MSLMSLLRKGDSMPNTSDIKAFIDSANVYNKIGENKQRALNEEAQRSDNYLLNQANLRNNAFELKRKEFELTKAQEAEKREKQSSALMSQMFASGAPERRANAEAGQEESLGDNLTRMGTSLMAVDPKKGLELIKTGSDFKTKARERISTDLEIKAKQAQVLGEIASFVTDDESAQAAVNDMAKLGRNVPERFRNFSTPEAKEWWGNQKSFAKNYAVSLAAERDALKSIQTKEKLQMDQERLDMKRKEQATKEELAKLRIAKGKASVKVTKDEVKREVGALNQLGEEVEDLPIETKRIMAEDVAAATVSILAEDPSLSQDEAKGRARELIKSRIVDGEYPLGSKQTKTVPFVEGKVYTDASGNKAKYSNGKWIPQ
jgi:hypothetical protein